MLLFFYTGFVLGTLWCGLAQSFETLLMARIVTGLFGGVIGSVVLAIATDLFAPQQRGRVMGLIQTAFAASQVLGIPAGLYLSNHWDWHIPFLAMAALGVLGGDRDYRFVIRFSADVADRVREVLGVLLSARACEYYGRADGQRGEEFPDRGIEADGGLLQQSVAGCDAEAFDEPEDVVTDPAVGDQGALGGAGGSGGVDEVGEVFGRDRGIWVVFRELFAQLEPGFGVECDGVWVLAQGLELFEAVLLGDEDGGVAVLEHEVDACGGIFRVDGDVCAAGLEDGEHGHDHVAGARHAECAAAPDMQERRMASIIGVVVALRL
jgi:hypothetical protein